MSDFIQLHVLTAYPPANLNRDDMGRPKTAYFGCGNDSGNRLRISSQSLKRAWRTSTLFEEALSGHVGTRTKRYGEEVLEKLLAGDMEDELALANAQAIAAVFGKLQKSEKLEKLVKLKKSGEDYLQKWKQSCYIEQLVHIAPEEKEAVDKLVKSLCEEPRAVEKSDLDLLRKSISAVDIAMFGRMLADKPDNNVEAAIQVAHALTVHAVTVEDDFFTAVDDLNSGEEDAGAGHLGELGFGSGLFYLYLCIDKSLLMENLQHNLELADKGLHALLDCVTTVAPTGKQNSFASRASASYLRVERGPQQPRALSVGFMKPIQGDDIESLAIGALEDQADRFSKAYGSQYDTCVVMNTRKEDGGSLAEVKAFVGG